MDISNILSLQFKSVPVKKIDSDPGPVKTSRLSEGGHGAARQQDQGAIVDDQSNAAGEGCGVFELSLATTEPLNPVV